MVLPINSAWKCCETCEHWCGCRHLTPLGLVADRTTQESGTACRVLQGDLLDVSLCTMYEKWHDLTSYSYGNRSEGRDYPHPSA